MAELFNNYLTKKSHTPNDNTKFIIVPKAGESISDSGTGSRTQDSVVQLHSIYITQEVTTNQSANPIANAAFVTLSVVDTTNNLEYPIASNIMVLPHSSFYIEKAITLKSQDRLILKYTTLNSTSKTIGTVCSGVELI